MELNPGSLGSLVKITKYDEQPRLVGQVARITGICLVDINGKEKRRCWVELLEEIEITVQKQFPTMGGIIIAQGPLKTKGPFPTKGRNLEPYVPDQGVPDVFKNGWKDEQ